MPHATFSQLESFQSRIITCRLIVNHTHGVECLSIKIFQCLAIIATKYEKKRTKNVWNAIDIESDFFKTWNLWHPSMCGTHGGLQHLEHHPSLQPTK